MDETRLAAAAATIADGLVQRYTLEGDLLARRVNVDTGTITDPRGLPDELGDYAQYVWRVGEWLARPDLQDWAVTQAVRLATLYQRDSGLVMLRPTPARPGLEYFDALRIGDTVWGLVEMAGLSRQETVGRARDRLFDALFGLARHGGQLSYGGWFAGRRRLLTVPLAEPCNTAYVGEALVNAFADTGDPQYLVRARELLLPWLQTPSFRQHGLFRRWVTTRCPGAATLFDLQFRARHRPGLGVTFLVKGDAYLVMALLALWRAARDEPWAQPIPDALRRWLLALAAFRLPDGRFANYYDPATRLAWRVRLGETHSVIETLLDLHVDLQASPALEWACACADAWLAHLGRAGLLPEHEDLREAWLDPQTDFCIDLYKLGRLTGDERYTRAGDRLLEAVLQHFERPFGLAQKVDPDTGAPLAVEVETKFLGLFLKVLLIRRCVGRGEDLFGSSLLRRLCSDR
ncbi:MAG: hypothetical protein HYU66_26215 [Armatimonadetes bacterium]|nr:hypothetical protein [Armatimonadota bacterium]